MKPENLKLQIANNKTELVLKALLAFSEKIQDNEIVNEIILINQRYNSWKTNKRKNIREDQGNVEKNRINSDILELIDSLDHELLLIPSIRNDQIFNEIIRPIYEKLNEIHSNYIETFSIYRDRLYSIEEEFTLEHEIFFLIENDSLFSRKIRIDLDVLIKLTSDYKYQILESFLNKARDYLKQSSEIDSDYLLNIAEDTESFMPVLRNKARRDIYKGLREIVFCDSLMGANSESIKYKCIKLLDSIVSRLHDFYEDFEIEFQKLRLKNKEH